VTRPNPFVFETLVRDVFQPLIDHARTLRAREAAREKNPCPACRSKRTMPTQYTEAWLCYDCDHAWTATAEKEENP
jgi:ribosomal protein L37AE/L43A